MPDIFGMNAENYKINTEHNNYDALVYSRDDQVASVNTLQYIKNNIPAIQAQIDNVVHSDFHLNKFIPVNTSGTSKKTYKGEVIAAWTKSDIASAITDAKPINNDTIVAATIGCIDHIEIVGLQGDDWRDLKGLITQTTKEGNSDHPATRAVSRYISTPDGKGRVKTRIIDMSPIEIINMMEASIRQLMDNYRVVWGNQIPIKGLSIYLPIHQASYISNKQMQIPDGTSTTIWEYFSQQNAWTCHTDGDKPILHFLQEASGAATQSSYGKSLDQNLDQNLISEQSSENDDRMIVALNNADDMEMIMPSAPQVSIIEENDECILAHVVYTISELNVKRPQAILYIDGV